MSAVATSLLRAFGQLADRAILRVLFKSLALTLAVFVLMGIALWRGLSGVIEPYVTGYGGGLGALAALILTIVAGWLLFRIVAIAVLQFFADEVVIAVEHHHYPEAAANARKLPFRDELANSVRGAARALLFNLLALPVALVLLFTAIGPAIVFGIVNAVLLGRELTEMAWLRHRGDPGAPLPASPIERFMLGGAIAALMLIPFANLLAPIIGAAAGTHLVQARLGTRNA